MLKTFQFFTKLIIYNGNAVSSIISSYGSSTDIIYTDTYAFRNSKT